jgi:hypothetical protein
LSDPYGKNVNTELRAVNGSGLKPDTIAAIDLERHVVEERARPAKDFESWETVSIARTRSVPSFYARRNFLSLFKSNEGGLSHEPDRWYWLLIPYRGGGRSRGVGRGLGVGLGVAVGVGVGVAVGVAVGVGVGVGIWVAVGVVVGVGVGVTVGVAVGVGVGVPVGSPVMICTTPSLMALAQRLPLPSNSTATTCQWVNGEFSGVKWVQVAPSKMLTPPVYGKVPSW